MARVLVTGGNGMVARHVAEVARARGHAVTLADLAEPDVADRSEGCRHVVLDVRDLAGCRALTADATVIIHCAAVVGPWRAKVDPLVTLAVNVTGTANLLQAAHETGARLINLSTATLYGHRADLAPLSEDDPTDPLTVYDGSKLMSETYCAAHRRTYGSDVTSIRTGFVFGQGTRIGEYFLPRVMAGEVVREPAGAAHPCDFTYVVDLAEGLMAAAEAPALPESVYNITGGVLRTRGELAAAVRALVPGASIEIGPGQDPARHLRGVCVIERVRRDFGWSPRFTLEQGLADWHRRALAAGARP